MLIHPQFKSLRNVVVFGLVSIVLASTVNADDSKSRSVDETLLHFEYTVVCDSKNPGYGAIRGDIVLPERRIRFDLYRKNHNLYLSIGKNKFSDVKIEMNPSSHCSLRKWNVDAFSVDDLPPTLHPTLPPNKYRLWGERYSPVVVPRRDQMKNRETDVPLGISYSVIQLPEGHSLLQYTVIFSGEDSKRNARSNLAQMTAYGRQTDIEYVYQVELNPAGERVRDWYQGGILKTPIGHAKLRFKGGYLAGTNHPILYNSTRNNIFRDRPCASTGDLTVMYAYGNLEEIPFPLAREVTMWEQLWMFDASDLELKMEGKVRYSTSEFLFIKVLGENISGNFTPRLALSRGPEFKVRSGNFDRLGENLWGREGYTALLLTPEVISALRTRTLKGNFFFESKSPRADQSRILDLQFFVIDLEQEISEVIDLTAQFDCISGPDFKSRAAPYNIRCKLNASN